MGFSEEASECISLYSPSLETRRPGSGSSWPVAVASHLSGLPFPLLHCYGDGLAGSASLE